MLFRLHRNDTAPGKPPNSRPSRDQSRLSSCFISPVTALKLRLGSCHPTRARLSLAHISCCQARLFGRRSGRRRPRRNRQHVTAWTTATAMPFPAAIRRPSHMPEAATAWDCGPPGVVQKFACMWLAVVLVPTRRPVTGQAERVDSQQPATPPFAWALSERAKSKAKYSHTRPRRRTCLSFPPSLQSCNLSLGDTRPARTAIALWVTCTTNTKQTYCIPSPTVATSIPQIGPTGHSPLTRFRPARTAPLTSAPRRDGHARLRISHDDARAAGAVQRPCAGVDLRLYPLWRTGRPDHIIWIGVGTRLLLQVTANS